MLNATDAGLEHADDRGGFPKLPGNCRDADGGIVRIHVRMFHGFVGMPYARDTPSNTSRYPRPSMRRPPEATS